MRISRPATLSLRTVALLYLAVLLLLPLGVVFFRTFEHGFGQQPVLAAPRRGRAGRLRVRRR